MRVETYRAILEMAAVSLSQCTDCRIPVLVHLDPELARHRARVDALSIAHSTESCGKLGACVEQQTHFLRYLPQARVALADTNL